MDTIIMSTVRVRDKSQITIPADIGKRAGIQVNDFLEVELTQSGAIVLKPIRATTQSKIATLMQYKGAGKSMLDAINPDSTIEDIRKDRDAWKH